MIFDSDLPTDNPLDGYNNSIIEFHPTDEEKEIQNAIITVSGYDYELTPNLNRKFKFNFKHIVKVLINLNHFNNLIEPDLTTKFIYKDDSLFLKLDATITINFTDESNEEVNKSYLFLKSVSQHYGPKYTRNNSLFPLLNQFNQQYELTYFEGFPFDIAFYSDDDRNITIKNKKNNVSKSFPVEKGVNRFFLSDGVNTITTLNEIPILLGYNALEFWMDGQLIFTINVDKHDVECGKYLRWFNNNGGYSYFLLKTNHKTSTSSRTLATLKSEDKNLDESSGNFTITGKSATQTKNFLSQLLRETQYELFSKIFTSPKVQLLNKDRLTEVKEVDWLDVKVVDGAFTKRSNKSQQRIPIGIELPKLYTQTL